MTTIELKTSITSDLDLLTGEMLEKVSQYVKQLITSVKGEKTTTKTVKRKKIEITPGVARLYSGSSISTTDEERDQMIYEYIKEKYA